MILARFCSGSLEYFMSRSLRQLAGWMDTAAGIAKQEKREREGW